MSNFRRVYEAQIIEVLEGRGSEESPYDVVRYVIVDGRLIGKVESVLEAN